MWMWCLGSRFSAERAGVGLMAGLYDVTDLFQAWSSYDSMNVQKWSEIQVCPLCMYLVNPLLSFLPVGCWEQDRIAAGCKCMFLQKAASFPVQTYTKRDDSRQESAGIRY